MNTNLIVVDFKKPALVSGQDRVLLRDIWEQLKSQRAYAHWVNSLLPSFEEGSDFGIFVANDNNSKSVGRPAVDHWVTVNTAKEICMMSKTEEGRKVRQYFIECEQLVYENNLEHQLREIPKLVNSDFLQAAADYARNLENKVAHLERTKAHISDKKTATAMATASAAVRQKNKALELVYNKDKEITNLKEKLGDCEDWATVVVVISRYPKLKGICNESHLGRVLSKKSRDMGYEIRKQVSPQYPGGVGIYHKDVVEAVRKQLLD